VEEYVKAYGGTRAIRKLLLCNNGIAAVKCIRSIRKWSYHTFGNDRVIQVSLDLFDGSCWRLTFFTVFLRVVYCDGDAGGHERKCRVLAYG
jgi:hypothetical protein